MHIGIDFGTTHTSAAIFDGQAVRFIPLDLQNRDPHLLRSMIYVDRTHQALLGLDAVFTYLRDNTGRLARIEQKVVGTISNTVARVTRHELEPDGPIELIYDVIIEEDVGAPGRLLQSIKTGLRDPQYDGTNIYDRHFQLSELIGIILEHVRTAAERESGQRIESLSLGRPVTFTETAEGDRLAETRLREAAERAGFKQVRFMAEPVAAALFYTREVRSPKHVLVFDFGGGTLDLTVMRADGRPLNGHIPTEILATQGVLVGGDDMDSALMRSKVAPYFGAGSHIDREGHPFPAHLISKLDRWQTIPELSRKENISLIRKARLNGNNPAAFAALESLATRNFGFALFEKIEQAKRELSEVLETVLAMQAEAIDLQVMLTRREFQTLILDEIAKVQQGLQQILDKAALLAENIDVVVTTGGSSLIPVFQMVLQKRFPGAEIVHSDTFGSVAAGLAIDAFRAYQK
jgi:hypothetical chaperone protein